MIGLFLKRRYEVFSIFKIVSQALWEIITIFNILTKKVFFQQVKNQTLTVHVVHSSHECIFGLVADVLLVADSYGICIEDTNCNDWQNICNN